MSPTSDLPSDDHQKTSDASARPLHFSPRIFSLDVMRGIAVLGALFVSIWMFGGFSSNQQNGLLIRSKGFNYRLLGTIDLFFDGKMRALIAIVFGAGMLLFLSKDNSKGNLSNADLFIRRQMWLILLGIINAVLLFWTHDLLFHLGIMGILLFPFVRMSARGLILAAVLTTLIYSGKNYWNYADKRKAYDKYLAVVAAEKKIAKDSAAQVQNKALAKAPKKDTLTKEQKQDKEAWEGIVAGMKYDPKKDDGENKEMRSGSYAKIYNHLLPRTQSREAQWTYTIGIWDLASMILLGMYLFKTGFFTNAFKRKNYLIIAATGIVAGLLLGWFRLHYNQMALHDYTQYVKGHWMPYDLFFPFERAFMAMSYAALVLFLIGSALLNPLWRGLAAAGKMALTNYLMQSIICTLFFAGFGMGYFGRLEQYQLYFMVLEICLVQFVFSVLWLRFFCYGPAEWLWRCLMQGRWLPNKLRKPEVTEPSIVILS